MNTYEEELRKAELGKLKAETEKINTEKDKITTEINELKKPLYKSLNFIKTLIAGVLGALAILGVFQSIIEPAYKRDIIEKELEISKKNKENYLLNDSIRITEKRLLSIQDSIALLEKTNADILKDTQIEKEKSKKLLDSVKIVRKQLDKTEKDIILQKKKTIQIINDQLKDLRGLNKEHEIHIQSIYFEYDKSSLSSEDKKQLDIIAELIMAHKFESFKVSIEGYSYEKGSYLYNRGLSDRRARIVLSYLRSKGVPPEIIQTKGYGESKPNSIILQKLDAETEKKLYELKSVVHIYLTY